VKFVDEYRDREAVQELARAIADATTRPWVVMEVCGGQTHSIVRYGLDEMLPEDLTLLHGPGCPVCVTSVEVIDRAHAIASQPGVIFCSFGDMLRVPGSRGDLLHLKAAGADIRIVYSPLDALALAVKNPERRVVFFAIGFETTAPANAMAVHLAHKRGVSNFSMLAAHVLVPPMLTAILQAPGNRVQAFLGPGHVCTVMGTREYEPVAARYQVPIAVAGFEPVDLLTGLLACVRQLERGEAKVETPYSRVVTRDGNARARALLDDVFEVTDRQWRGIGWIPKSGLRLRWELRAFDAERIFDVADVSAVESSECISGEILKGLKKPYECPAFGTRCTPDRPLGATMVSSEGACAAYMAYGRGPRSTDQRTGKRSLPIHDDAESA
jgi:hydrogenase expression/formation protein HypD